MAVILVTGATGQVGRRFVPRLLTWCGANTGVRVLVRAPERGGALARLGADVTVGDLREERDVRRALDGVETVVNIAAAFRGVPDGESWEVNRDAAVALGRAAVDAEVTRFVQVSTTVAYGVARDRPLREEDESVPGGPLWGAYAAAKAEAERDLFGLHGEHGLDVRVASLAYVYGEGDPSLARSLAWARDWPGNRRLALVHHADVAQGLLRVLRAPRAVAGGRKYHVVDDAPVTTVELHGVNGAAVPEGMGKRLDDDPWFGIASNMRLRDELGWRPLYPSMWTARDAGAL